MLEKQTAWRHSVVEYVSENEYADHDPGRML